MRLGLGNDRFPKMGMPVKQTARFAQPGRPRTFDEAGVLENAIELFCTSGFSAVGISDLTRATGLTVGSIYKAYRNKEGLFAKALAQYVAVREARIARSMDVAEDGRARIRALLGLYATLSQGKDGQRGCMVVAGIADLEQLGETAKVLRATLVRRRMMLTELVALGQRDGSIATLSTPEAVADVLLVLLQGMRLVGKGRAFPHDAGAFVAIALKVLD